MIRYFSCWLMLVAGLAAAPEASSSRSLRLVYAQPPEDAPEKLFLVAGSVIKEIALPRMSVSSQRLDLPAGPIRVFAAMKAPTRDNPLPADAPFADIPETMANPLVVLLSNGKGGPLAFQMLPVEFSRTAVPEGAVMWFNLTERILYVKLGSAQGTIAPRRSGVVMPSGKPGETYQAMVDLSPEPGETETQPFLRALWQKKVQRCTLMFVVVDPARKYPRLLSIPAVRDEEPESPKDKKRNPKKP